MDELTSIPKDSNEIQPWPDQVWNVDEIKINPNSEWHWITCPCKWCNATEVWKTQDGERDPSGAPHYFSPEQMDNVLLVRRLFIKKRKLQQIYLWTYLVIGLSTPLLVVAWIMMGGSKQFTTSCAIVEHPKLTHNDFSLMATTATRMLMCLKSCMKIMLKPSSWCQVIQRTINWMAMVRMPL